MEYSGTREYSSLLKTMVNWSLSDQPLPEELASNEAVAKQFSDEILGFLQDRPVVLLKNENAQVCYKRPGIQKDLRFLGVKLGFQIDVPLEPKLDMTKHDFTDLSNPPPCSKNDQDLMHLYQACEKVGLLRELFFEIVSHDSDYFRFIRPAFAVATFTPLNFDECSCQNNAYNRLYNDRRYVFEQQFMSHISSSVPNKTDTVKVVSMGSGMLLQDWKLIGLLLKEGYNNIQWVLVDPINSHNPRIHTLKEFVAKIKDAHVEISAYTGITEAQKDLEKAAFKAHAIVAIDFDRPAWYDLIVSSKHLQPAGKLFLGTGKHGFIIAQEQLTLLHQDAHCKAMSEDLEASIPKGYRGQVHIACVELWPVALHAIATLHKLGITSVRLSNVMHKEIAGTTAHELFKFFFPSFDITLETITKEEIITQIGTGKKFDFVLCQPLAEEVQKAIGIDTFEKVVSHVMNESCTAYLFDWSALGKFRWKLKGE